MGAADYGNTGDLDFHCMRRNLFKNRNSKKDHHMVIFYKFMVATLC